MPKPKTIKIHGRDYVTVAERIKLFNEDYKAGSIITEVTYDGDLVRCKATVTPDVSTPTRIFVGHSEEDRKSSMINKTSACENAETSAIGRALGLMGIGVLDSIASADEISKAKGREKVFTLPETPTTFEDPFNLTCTTCQKPHKGPYPQCYDCYKQTLKK